MKKPTITFLLALFSLLAVGQSESQLKNYFEGNMLIPKIDLPGSTDGIYIYPEKETVFDYGDYGKDIKQYGIGAYAGEPIMITKVVVKKNHIRFELGGGGYGGLFSESAHVSTPTLAKTSEEVELEKKIAEAKDDKEKKRLKKQLDRARSERQAEQARLEMDAEHTRALKEDRIAAKRASSGSRIHIKYDRKLAPVDLRIEGVLDQLAKYAVIDNQQESRTDQSATVQLHKGMTWAEANLLLGMPMEASTLKDQGLTVITCRYFRGDSIITARYVEGLLVSYTITSE